MIEIGNESPIRKRLEEIDSAYKQAPWQTMQKEDIIQEDAEWMAWANYASKGKVVWKSTALEIYEYTDTLKGRIRKIDNATLRERREKYKQLIKDAAENKGGRILHRLIKPPRNTARAVVGVKGTQGQGISGTRNARHCVKYHTTMDQANADFQREK